MNIFYELLFLYFQFSLTVLVILLCALFIYLYIFLHVLANIYKALKKYFSFSIFNI